MRSDIQHPQLPGKHIILQTYGDGQTLIMFAFEEDDF